MAVAALQSPHSIQQMDWIGNWRFHGVEVFLHRTLLYPRAAIGGFGIEAMLAYGALTTTVGHFATRISACVWAC
jgi:hypothetical protein